MADFNILEYAKKTENRRQAWLGKNPQFDMDIVDVENSVNFRVSPQFHSKYDTVWIFQKTLDEYNPLSWKIIVDEAIRLLKEEGLFIVKLKETSYLTRAMLKSFLFRNINLEVELDFQNFKDKQYTMGFKIKRKNIEIYKDKSWTFAMLTGGKSDDIVIKFLKSIRDNEKTKSQIIISSPRKEIYDEYDVEYIDLSGFRDEQYAEISKKKNYIADKAKNANLLIAHDRYYLSSTFFDDFEKYGYDYDFLAVRQTLEDGGDYPFYCFLYRPILSLTHPVNCRCYEHIFDTTYVNGGLMVFKTHNIKNIKFNNLLFWKEMEDVEITQEFMKSSLIPRVNYIASAFAVLKNETSRDKRRDFMLFDRYDGTKVVSYKKHKDVDKFNSIANLDTMPAVNPSSVFNFMITKKRKFPFFGIRIKFGRNKKIFAAEKFVGSDNKKVLFDISILGSAYGDNANRTGVYRVAQESLKTLASADNLELYFCASKNNIDECIAYLNEYYPEYKDKFVNCKHYGKIKRFFKNFQKKYDYYFSPYFEVHKNYRQNKNTKKIIIIYDLIQALYPQWVLKNNNIAYKKFLKLLKKDVTCLCISSHTRNDLIKYKPELKPEKLKVIPLGADDNYNPLLDKDICKVVTDKYNIKTPYFFSISSQNPRKNFDRTIKCFIKFIEKNDLKDISLVLAGPQGWGGVLKEIDLDKYKNQIIFTGYVAENDLPYLYKNAICSIYLSLYEGFGLPPLESMKAGIPVIASNLTSIPEVVGDAGILINPLDENKIIEAFEKIYFDEKLRQELSLKGLKQAEKYTWGEFSRILKKEFT